MHHCREVLELFSLQSLHTLPSAPRWRVTARDRARTWALERAGRRVESAGFHLTSTSLWDGEFLGAASCKQSMDSCFALCYPSGRTLKWSGKLAGVCQGPFCATVNLPWHRGSWQVSSQKLCACPEPSPSLTKPSKNGAKQSMVSVLFPGHSLTMGTQGNPFQLTGVWQG